MDDLTFYSNLRINLENAEGGNAKCANAVSWICRIAGNPCSSGVYGTPGKTIPTNQQKKGQRKISDLFLT